jgi:hypothetical protein
VRLAPEVDPGPLLDAASRRGTPVRLLDLCHLPRLRARYQADLLLVRPDQHVAWRGGEVGDAGAVLSRVLGEQVAAARA